MRNPDPNVERLALVKRSWTVAYRSTRDFQVTGSDYSDGASTTHSGSLVLYGSGGFGREVAWLVEAISTAAGKVEVTCFIDDAIGAQGGTVNGIPVFSLDE